jgi:hypothetical protein
MESGQWQHRAGRSRNQKLLVLNGSFRDDYEEKAQKPKLFGPAKFLIKKERTYLKLKFLV